MTRTGNLEELPAYDPDADCPKCECHNVDTTFNDTPLQMRMGLIVGALTRECKRCGHFWQEKPLDHEKYGGGDGG